MELAIGHSSGHWRNCTPLKKQVITTSRRAPGGCEVRSHRKVKRFLFVAASSEAGWSQQAVDPVDDSCFEDEMSLNDTRRPVIDEDLSLVDKEQLLVQSLFSILLTAFLYDLLTTLFGPPQEKVSCEPCSVRAESR